MSIRAQLQKDSISASSKGQVFLNFAKIFTGLLFVFSGLIKANDPLGFSYKLQEYFGVFRMTFLNDLAVEIAVILCALEILLGALLLLALWRNAVAWGLLVLIVFFTFLTFYSAVFEVVKSCGCFGDAIPLTPWQSFAKDLVLLVLILYLFKHRAHLRPVIRDNYTSIMTTVALAVVSLGVGVYTVNFLPVVDFLPYKEGNHLPSLMVMPEGKSGDVYEITYTLKHKQTGEQNKISDQAYLEEEWWKNEDWEVVGEPQSRLIEKGYTIPISDLVIYNGDGVNVTQELLSNPDPQFFLVAWDLEHTNQKGFARIHNLLNQLAEAYHIRAVLLTSSSPEQVELFSERLGEEIRIEPLYVDAVPLKSMVRSNPGLVMMQDGRILHKWHFHTVPSIESIQRNYFKEKSER